MKTIRFVGITLLTVLLSVDLSSCSKSDDEHDEVRKWNCVFSLDGQDIKPGDTIHVADKLTTYKLYWNDADGVADVMNTQMVEYNPDVIQYENGYMNCFEFNINGLGKSKMILHDYNTNQDFIFYIVVDPLDLREHFAIKGPYSDYLIDEKLIDGPFICLKLSKEIYNYLKGGYLKVKSFGYEKGMTTASVGSSGNGYWVTDYKTVAWYGTWGSLEEDGKTYVGKINLKTAIYWSFIIEYRGLSHEIRRYGNSETFLWDGEWNN